VPIGESTKKFPAFAVVAEGVEVFWGSEPLVYPERNEGLRQELLPLAADASSSATFAAHPALAPDSEGTKNHRLTLRVQPVLRLPPSPRFVRCPLASAPKTSAL